MELLDVLDIYCVIIKSADDIAQRRRSFSIRKNSLSNSFGFTKNAFDTRRINQETDYIPRRGLQNYHRSEAFLSESMSHKLEAFTKLADVLTQLKREFGKQPAWQDSYTRVLLSSVDKGIRTNIKDGDYSDTQPSVGSLDYLEELMYVRYRLTPDNLLAMSPETLKEAILQKDELLVHGDKNYEQITPMDVSKFSYDTLVDKMLTTLATVMANQKQAAPDDNLTNKLFDVKATKDNPEVERSVMITIKDKIVNEKPISKSSSEETATDQKIISDDQPNDDKDDVISIEE